MAGFLGLFGMKGDRGVACGQKNVGIACCSLYSPYVGFCPYCALRIPNGNVSKYFFEVCLTVWSVRSHHP